MSEPRTIFLTGATGYIGGSVLARLLDLKNLQITVLVRDADKAKDLEAVGVKTVVGSNDDHHLLADEAAKSDVVFACANADDLGAAKAILKGLKERHAKTGATPKLIHTSGTGVLADQADGHFAAGSQDIYSDMDIPKIESLRDSQPHRIVDLLLVEADTQGYVKTYIVLPSTIYGLASNVLVDKKIQNSRSQQIPGLVNASLDRKQGGMVGEGKNLWPNVHIEEVTDLFITIYEGAFASSPPVDLKHGREGFYFGANGEHNLYEVSEHISKYLEKKGIGKSVPTSFTDDECVKYFGSKYLGSNSRCKAERSISVGWKPTKGTADMLASIPTEVELSLKK